MTSQHSRRRFQRYAYSYRFLHKEKRGSSFYKRGSGQEHTVSFTRNSVDTPFPGGIEDEEIMLPSQRQLVNLPFTSGLGRADTVSFTGKVGELVFYKRDRTRKELRVLFLNTRFQIIEGSSSACN